MYEPIVGTAFTEASMLPLIIGVVALVGAVAGPAKTVSTLAAAGALELNRRRGHRRGEGPLTTRDTDPGIFISPDSGDELGKSIALFAQDNADLQEFIGKVVQLTHSEGQQLRAMVIPVKHHYARIAEVRAQLVQLNEVLEVQEEADQELAEVIQQLIGQQQKLKAELEALLLPITLFLKSIPAVRAKG